MSKVSRNRPWNKDPFVLRDREEEQNLIAETMNAKKGERWNAFKTGLKRNNKEIWQDIGDNNREMFGKKKKKR